MKKKIFSALLMGVFVMASMSMFVSCKDYDDDIDGLNLSQADLLSKIEALESSINANQTTLSEQLAAAQKKAEEALSAAQANGQDISSLKSLIDAANTAAADAGTKAAAAEVAANTANEKAAEAAAAAANASGDAAAAQAEAEQAKTAAAEAQTAAEQAKADAEAALEKAKEALENAQQGASDADVQKALADAASALSQITSLETRVSQLETLTAGLDQLKQDIAKAVTKEEFEAYKKSVENYQAYFDNLFAMVTSVEIYDCFGDASSANGFYALNMVHGKVAEDSKFGDNEAYKTSNPIIEYLTGTEINGNAGLIVRVNPVNAELNINDENCQIAIVNSKGERMDDFIKIASAERYTDILTRGSEPINSGLWKIKLEYADGVDMDAFKNAVKNDDGKVLFALAVNNTDTLQSDRYVATNFRITMSDKDFEPSSVLNYYVNGYPVTYLMNRYNGSGTSEKMWKDNKPATVATDDNTVAAGSADNRVSGFVLPAEVNEDITVRVTDPNIEYYYVVLDKDFANADDPSEWNAWESYSYEGVGETVKATDELTFKIKSSQANGDVIGFRVFAVNYDGTLADPDGRAFYVALGDAAVPQTVNVDVLADAETDNSAIVKLPAEFKDCANGYIGSVNPLTFDPKSEKSLSKAIISYQLCKDDKGTAVSNWKDAKYIKITLNNANYFLDNGTFSFVIKGMDGLREVNVLNVNVTKKMPTADDKQLTFKENQMDKETNTYTCYVDPDQDKWNVSSAYGYKTLNNVVTGLTDTNFRWTFENAKKESNKDVDYVLKSTTGTYELAVGSGYVDNKTSHNTTVEYVYKNISLVLKDGTLTQVEEYPVNLIEFNTIFASALYNNGDNGSAVMSYSWDKVSGKDVCCIIYGTETPGKDVDSSNKSYTNIPDGKTLTDYIKASNTYDNGLFGSAWRTDIFVNGIKSVKLISDNTKEEDYYTVTYSDLAGFTFKSKSGTTNPIADVASTLIIEATDAFGKTNTYELPFMILKR